MTAEHLVSIVVVSWNTQDLLRACLASASVASAELHAPVEIIVVDNASSDGSVGMVEKEFPEIRIIANAANVGFATATNQGIRESKGRYVLLLNPDTKGTDSFLNTLVSFLEDNPSAGAAGPRLLGKHGEEQVSCYPLPTLARELWRLFHLDRFYKMASYPPSRWHSQHPQSVETVQGACMLIRREALEQVGFLDERFFIYSEEVDLCHNLLDLGWTIFWIPQAVIMHYGGESTVQVAPRMFLELYRSKIQYFRKHLGLKGALAYKAVLLAATLPRILMPALAIAFTPSRREALRVLLRNYYSLLIQLPAL